MQIQNKKTLIILLCILSILFLVLVASIFISKSRGHRVSTEINQIESEKIEEPLFSAEKLDWQEITSSAEFLPRDSHGLVAFKNKLWVMGGLNGNCCVVSLGNVNYEKAPHFADIWSSEDGVTWKLENDNAPWGERRSIQVVEFNNKLWLLGGWGPEIGYKNDIWSSEDGINWKLEKENVEWSAREGHYVTVFNNKIWVTGGVTYDKRELKNDVWFSDDGINWQLATNNAQWQARWDHAVVGFNNKLWLIGGMGFANTLYNFVWSSENGINWKLENYKPPFTSRQGHGLVELENKLWLVGRLDADLNGGVNDIWFSEDGINWQKTEKDPVWFGREDVGIVVFKNKIWVVGGMDKNFVWNNDVWVSK